MTTGTVHTYVPARGTGSLVNAAGTTVPFSSDDHALRAGDEIAVRIHGGICGLYATHAAPREAPAPAPIFGFGFGRALAAG